MGSEMCIRDSYEIARDKLRQLPDMDSQSEVLFYIGLCYLYQTRTNHAMAAFYLKQVLEQNTPVKKEEAQWYITLCYLKTGEVEKAYQTLELIENDKAWKSNDAKTLLDLFRN